MGILEGIFGGKILYYPGCVLRYKLKEQDEKYKKILEKLGVEFSDVENFNCCGMPALEFGYGEDFSECRLKNLGIFKGDEKGKLKEVISACGYCIDIFEGYSVRCRHINRVILDRIKRFSKASGIEISKIGEDEEVREVRESGLVVAGVNYYFLKCKNSRGEDEALEILKRIGYNLKVIEVNCPKALLLFAGHTCRNIAGMNVVKGFEKDGIQELDRAILIVSCPYCYRGLLDFFSWDKGSEEGKEGKESKARDSKDSKANIINFADFMYNLICVGADAHDLKVRAVSNSENKYIDSGSKIENIENYGGEKS